jgi:hypothetical protein
MKKRLYEFYYASYLTQPDRFARIYGYPAVDPNFIK